jgi:raffinose/stachyose/melibiose transport system permease protein
MINTRTNQLLPWLALAPVLFLFSVFVLLPSLSTAVLSFTDYSGNIQERLEFVGFRNYLLAVTTDLSGFLNALRVTALFSFSITIIQNVLGVALALLVNLPLRFRNLYRSIIFLPTTLGVIVHGLVWTLVFDPFSGPVNKLLNFFGTDSALLGDKHAALWLLVFVVIWGNVGNSMVIYLAGLQNIPREFYEAAQVDGASGWSLTRYITLPLLQPAITINMLLSIIGTLGTLDIILVLTSGGPGYATSTLAMYIYRMLFQGKSYVTQGYAAALSMIHFLIILTIVVFALRQFTRREAGAE